MTVVRTVSLLALFFVLGLVSGQKLMSYAYDPAVLEYNVLNFIETANLSGCAGPDRSYQKCAEKAKKYRNDMSEIFHNKIWDRPAPKRKVLWKANSF